MINKRLYHYLSPPDKRDELNTTKMKDTANLQIMALLRNETRDQHDRFEKLPFFKALTDKALSIENYIRQLKGLAIIFSVMEHQIYQIDHPFFKKLLSGYKPKYPLLQSDLGFLDKGNFSDYLPSVYIALDAADHILTRFAEMPLSLLGYLYVLEGSTRGSIVLKPKYAECFKLNDDQGLAFLSGYGNKTDENWASFSHKMNDFDLDETQKKHILEAASECFDLIYKLYNKIYTTKTISGTFHVTTINPEAGNHPIPTDAKEIAAAITASDKCWDRYPYFGVRYGERGFRFGRGDSAYLASLINLPQEGLEKQVKWLTNYLALKGIPGITMKTHLEELYLALLKAYPDKQALYVKLFKASAILETDILKFFDLTTSRKLVEKFNTAVEYHFEHSLCDTAILSISAVIDEKNGCAGALPAFQDWITDPDRFSKRWINAVNDLVGKVKILTKM